MMWNKQIILVGIIFSLIMLYIIMLLDTNKLMQYASDVFLGLIPESETEGRPIEMYNYSDFYYENYGKNVDLKLKRVFNIHNFFNGYIIVYYSVFMYDYNGEMITGSSDVFSIWKIHKEKGQWLIIDIIEAP